MTGTREALEEALRRWLHDDHLPPDLYSLLGTARLDPNRQALAQAVRTAYAWLLPYQSHTDQRTAARAVALQHELGRAAAVLSDAEKLRQYEERQIEALRQALAAAQRRTAAIHDVQAVRRWLRTEQGVHPDRVNEIVNSLCPGLAETIELDAYGTNAERPAGQQLGGEYVLKDLPPPVPRSPIGPLTSPPDNPVSFASVEVVPERPAIRPRRPQPSGAGPAVPRPLRDRPRPRGALAERRRTMTYRGLLFVLGLVSGAILLFVVLLVVCYQPLQSCSGRLIEIRGHRGEIHLVVLPDGASAGQTIEAFTTDYRFGRELSDYTTAGESNERLAARSKADGSAGPTGVRNSLPQGGESVVMRGRAANANSAAFRLTANSSPLWNLFSVEKVGQPRSRAQVGRKRAMSLRSDQERSTLGRLMRLHPSVGSTIAFDAHWHSWEHDWIRVTPGSSDLRELKILFSGTTAADFSNYKPKDAVYVVGLMHESSTPTQLVITGESIRRLSSPASPVTSKARQR